VKFSDMVSVDGVLIGQEVATVADELEPEPRAPPCRWTGRKPTYDRSEGGRRSRAPSTSRAKQRLDLTRPP